MRPLLLAGASVLALGVVSAQAADIVQQRRVVQAAPVYTAPYYNWTGGYIGINGGGGWGRSSFGAPFASNSYNLSGGVVGATLGYNFQAGALVWGVEGDLDWSNIRGSGPCGLTTCETRNGWLGTVRGRIGYAADRFMPYVTGGLAVGDIRTNITGVGSANTTKAGWTLGAGVEWALWQNWTAKVEYLYVDLGRGGSIAGSDASFHTSLVRAGLNYRF
jgi:outer membrane immunogenic protein